jgi:rsbT co-antagonist protein RsbR
MTIEQMEPLARLAWIEKLLSSVSGFIYVYNATTQSNVYANRDMGYILGYSPEELREMGSALLATIMHPDDFARLSQTIGRLMTAADDEVVEWEYRVRDRSGNWVWFQDRMSVFSRNEQGNLVEYVGSVEDVTGRKQIETHLYESQQRFQLALEGSGDGTWDWNISTNEAVLSNRYREMFGYSQEELPDNVDSWLSNIHPDDMPSVQQHLQDYLEGRSETYAVEHRVRHKNGEWVWVLSRGKVILRDEAGNPVRMTGTISDISERKRAEEERIRLQEQIISNQEATLRELSTPLIPISDHAVVMPIVGSVDSNRTQQVLEILLTGVVERQADTVILDITGVQVVDTQVANAFIHIAQAVRLLGAQVIMTGIQPHIAQTMVHLGIDLSEVVTRRTLQEGIASALNA